MWEDLAHPHPMLMVAHVAVEIHAAGVTADGTLPQLAVWLVSHKQNGNSTSNVDGTKQSSLHQVKCSMEHLHRSLRKKLGSTKFGKDLNIMALCTTLLPISLVGNSIVAC